MNLNKIIIVLSIFLLCGCGYQPIFSKKKINQANDFSIEKIEFNGTNKLNQYLKNDLQKYMGNEERSKKLNLKINNQISKDDTSKDKQGNTQVFSMQITFYLDVIENDINIGSREFSKSFEYNNQSNKFNLTQYENNIKKNLVSEISQDLILYLYSLK